MLGVNLDNTLKFETHIESILQKASRKLNALARLTPYMDLSKKRILMNAFFYSQFNYCPVIWMFHSCILNNKINRLHERCLRIVYNDKQSSFEELLNKDSSVSIHHRNIQSLAIEMYKVASGISPELLNEVFQLRGENHYNLRHTSQFIIPPVNTVFNGSESAFYLGPKILELIPSEVKQIGSLAGFKKEIKNWKPINCPCRLCKIYIQNVGFL